MATLLGWLNDIQTMATTLLTSVAAALFTIGVIYLAFGGAKSSNIEKGAKTILWAAVGSALLAGLINIFAAFPIS